MKLSIEITEKDYVRAKFLAMRPRLWAKVIGCMFILWMFAMLIIGLYKMAFGKNPLDTESLTMVIIGVYFVLLFYAFWPQKFRKSYRQRKYNLITECEIDNDAITNKNSIGNSRLPWDYFRRWRENKHLFILYPVDELFHIFPKHCFASEQDINDFRRLLFEKIGQEK